MATPKKAYYKHHERTTDTDAKTSAKTREVVLSTQGKKIIAKMNDGSFLEFVRDGFKDVVSYSSLSAAISDIGSASVRLVVSSPVTLTANVTIPANVELVGVKGGSINRAGFTLTINGPFSAGDFEFFTGSGTTVFGVPGETRVAWFYDGAGDYAAAFNAAFAARGSLGNKIINPPISRIAIASTLTGFTYDHIDWNGFAASPQDGTVPAIVWAGSAGGIMFQSTSGVVGCKIRNIVFDGAYLTQWCMDINLMRRSDFVNITLTKTIGFIRSLNCYYSSFVRYLYFLQTPGTHIGGAGQPTLAQWTAVCNSSSAAPIMYRSNANNLRLEKHSASRIGGYEIPSGGAPISQLIMLGGQNIKMSLPTFESLGMNTVGDPDAFGFQTGLAGDGAGMLSFLVLSGVSALNSNSHRLYYNVTNTGSTRTVDVYSDLSKLTLVASGSRLNDGIIVLNPVGLSGIRGQVTIAYTANSTAANNIITWDYDTVTRLFNIQSGTSVEVDNAYLEAVNVQTFAEVAKIVRSGVRFTRFYLEDCHFRSDLFESSSLHDINVTEWAGVGVTCMGNYWSDHSTSTYAVLDRIEFHNRFLSLGGVNYSDETVGVLGMASTSGYAPIIYRTLVDSGLVPSTNTDSIGAYVLVPPGAIRNGLGRLVLVGRVESINSLETSVGWLFRPPAGVADYNVCVDSLGAVFIENQSALKGGAEQGKIVLATFHMDGAGTISAFTTITSPKGVKGIDLDAVGGVNVSGNFSVGTDKFQVDASSGHIATGSAATSDIGLWISESLAGFSGATQRGILSRPTFSSAATNLGSAIESQLRTAAASFTMASGHGLRVNDANRGAGSTITTLYGVKIEDQTQGATNYALFTGTGIVAFGDIVTFSASSTSRASLRLPHGAAPTSPVNGDVWTTTAGLYVRINGTTVGPLS